MILGEKKRGGRKAEVENVPVSHREHCHPPAWLNDDGRKRETQGKKTALTQPLAPGELPGLGIPNLRNVNIVFLLSTPFIQ